MKILWLCNIPLPAIAEHLNLPVTPAGGWMAGMASGIQNSGTFEMSIAFPVRGLQYLKTGKANNLEFHAFPATGFVNYNPEMELWFKQILELSKPDIVHIFGTELPHALAMTKTFGRPGRTVINLQGLCSIIAKHYMSGVPERVQRQYTLRDIFRRDNLLTQQRMFARRGEFEIQALQRVNHVIGRTTWDRACASQINPSAAYHFCNETLREEFYRHRWNINTCERGSMLISQATYPIKGLHFFLEAMPEILKRHPNAHLYIAGSNPTGGETLKERLKITSYSKFIRSIVKKLHLQKSISFPGVLDEKGMCQQFLKTHVFVSPSLVENESNSLSEAKIMGVPSVASFAGGVADRIINGVDGFLYQHDAPYMAAYYISKILSDDELALKLSNNSIVNALAVNNPIDNTARIIEIYKYIYSHG